MILLYIISLVISTVCVILSLISGSMIAGVISCIFAIMSINGLLAESNRKGW